MESCWKLEHIAKWIAAYYCTDKSCGWTKGPARHEVTWWWNDEVDKAIHGKRCLRLGKCRGEIRKIFGG